MPRVLFAACLLLVAALASTAAQAASAMDALRQFAMHTQSPRGGFSQHVMSSSKKMVETSGEFVFVRPGKFRWSYLRPYEQILVADGEHLTIYDKDLNQVTVRKLTDALGSTPAAILFGDNLLEKEFDLRDSGSHDGLDWLDATPKSRDTSFQKISIGFDKGELAAMELRDALGQVTQLHFFGVQRNVVVAPDVFVFVPPKGADILVN